MKRRGRDCKLCFLLRSNAPRRKKRFGDIAYCGGKSSHVAAAITGIGLRFPDFRINYRYVGPKAKWWVVLEKARFFRGQWGREDARRRHSAHISRLIEGCRQFRRPQRQRPRQQPQHPRRDGDDNETPCPQSASICWSTRRSPWRTCAAQCSSPFAKATSFRWSVCLAASSCTVEQSCGSSRSRRG
jgi:hypothetical protein